jgi:hypothetical protein
MLPTSIYELLPSSYLLIGSYIVSTSTDVIVVVAGCLFFFSGALIWILRSTNRRVDKGVKYYMLIFRHAYLPDTLYELLPFINVFIGLVLIRTNIHPALAVAGSALISWAFYCVVQRSIFRKHPHDTSKYKSYKPSK